MRPFVAVLTALIIAGAVVFAYTTFAPAPPLTTSPAFDQKPVVNIAVEPSDTVITSGNGFLSGRLRRKGEVWGILVYNTEDLWVPVESPDFKLLGNFLQSMDDSHPIKGLALLDIPEDFPPELIDQMEAFIGGLGKRLDRDR